MYNMQPIAGDEESNNAYLRTPDAPYKVNNRPFQDLAYKMRRGDNVTDEELQEVMNYLGATDSRQALMWLSNMPLSW